MPETVVIMSYQERLWWDFVEKYPNFVLGSLGFLVIILATILAYKFFKKRY